MATSRPISESGDGLGLVVPPNQDAADLKPVPAAQPAGTPAPGPFPVPPVPGAGPSRARAANVNSPILIDTTTGPTPSGGKRDGPVFVDTKTGTAPSNDSANRRPGNPEDDEKDRSEPVTTMVLEQSPPWLFSMVFHLLMVIIMGLIVYANIPRKPLEINAETVYAEKLGDQLEIDAPGGIPDVKSAEETVITPENLPPVPDPFAAPEHLDARAEGTVVSSDIQATEIGLALSGRRPGSARQQLGGKYGQTGGTIAAVGKGLDWLARNQRPDGSWSLCGPYSSAAPRFNECEESATAMALLAFQGDGNTHLEGKYQKNVVRGWNWLLKQQDADGCFFQVGDLNNYRFYVQGQCSIAICELYAMSRDTKYRVPAQHAIDFCLRSQSPEGGWRYNPNSDSDVSVTGWIVMALQSAKMAGLNVPRENLKNVERFLNSVALEGGSRYPYQKDGEARRSMTAEALLMRQYLGWKRDDQRLVNGVNWITSPQNLIDFNNNRDAYYWYYATQVTRHFGGDAWKRWNKVMASELPAKQVPHGKESGSWDPARPSDDQWGAWAGRLYVTCLSIYDLEVYYRYLPIYRDVHSDEAPQGE
jgi:hypothetical protein